MCASSARAAVSDTQCLDGTEYHTVRSAAVRSGRAPEIEVWFDFACPFSYLARQRLRRAVEQADGQSVQIISRSWQNDPTAPRDYGATMAEIAAVRYGMTLQEARAANGALTAEAAAEGLEYRIDDARPGNTFDAHRLFHFARERGRSDEFEERVLRAFICEAEPIGDRARLAALAVEVGLPRAGVETVLEGSEFADAVHDDRARGLAAGIAGVPFLVAGGRPLAGARTVEEIAEHLAPIWLRVTTPGGE
jgi:predicted DsbA family dithiol-disulfide isomerase